MMIIPVKDNHFAAPGRLKLKNRVIVQIFTPKTHKCLLICILWSSHQVLNATADVVIDAETHAGTGLGMMPCTGVSKLHRNKLL